MTVYTGTMGYEIRPYVFAVFLFFLVVMGLRKRSFAFLVYGFIFSIYLIYALGKVFFPLHISGAFVDTMRQAPLFAQVNLIPFYFGPYSTFGETLPDLLLNILLTIPFGFGINFLMQIPPKRIPWVALGVGLGLETAQLIMTLILRYPYRYVDINDVMMNAIGVLIGYAAFRIALLGFRQIQPAQPA